MFKTSLYIASFETGVVTSSMIQGAYSSAVDTLLKLLVNLFHMMSKLLWLNQMYIVTNF
uniref:Uncharacterized protein n=1 Tax=Arundo donax TaxID=35708 RepID=A0A0A8Y6L7_ARUDO